MRRVVMAGLLALLGGSGLASAASVVTELCYSPDQPALATTLPDQTTVFTCPLSGTGTLQDWAGRGFRVVRLTPVSAGGGQWIRQQLLIERGVRISTDSFEP